MTKIYLKSDEKIVILDASEGKVYIRSVPQKMIEWDGDRIFDYWAELLKLNVSDCEWMIANDDDFDEL